MRTGVRCAMLLLLGVGAARAERIIAEGDTWRYLRGTTFPSGWTTNGFDDSAWPTGPSGFGYGDGDDATIIITGTTNVFTRKTFTVAEPAAVNYLTVAVDYDDGFVAYINGAEVARRNMPAGAPSHTTFAAGNHEASRGTGNSDPQEREFIAVPTNVLVAGTNVIAVTVHNVSASSSDLSLIVELFTNITLVRGPFIQMPNSNAVSVVWRTDALTDSAVDYSLDFSYGTTVSDPTPTREHVVHIPGLLAGTNYHYRVRSGGVTLWEGDAFRTKRADGQPFRVVIVGDFGAGTAGMSNVAARVNAISDADLFLTVGDNIYPGGQPGLLDPYWFSQYASTMRRAPCMPALGNHDVDGGAYSGAAFLNSFHLPTNGPAGQIERNYSFDYGNAHFACFDSNPFTNVALNASVCNAIQTWLSNDLAGATQPWKIVYFHHPPYTSDGGSAHADNAGVKTNILPVVEAAGVQFVFDGHNHFYERQNAINGVYHIITGAGGQSLYAPSNRKPYSAGLQTTSNSFSIVAINGSRLSLRQIAADGGQIDEFDLDISHPFKMDGRLDDASWLRADNGLKLYAAIRQNYLYVATQDAGEGSDHFLYVNNVLSTNRAANWAKAGQVMQWDCFLADENDNAFQRWYDQSEQFLTNFPAFQSMTSGLNNNGSFNNGVLEGTLDLANRFGAFPQQLYLAAAAFLTTNGGALAAFVPTGNSGGLLTNFLAVSARAIALDPPVANAGTNQTAEAGMTVTLDGSASTAPSGLPVSFLWTQLSGTAVTLIHSNTALASFAAQTNVSDALVFQLTVNDTRFDSNAVTTVTLTPMTDSDGDGLSDTEETTGQDNVLTPANPNGHITDPLNADTDGDGASDGDEAIAGTDPNSAASVFRITNADGEITGFRIQWPTVTGKTYGVEYRNDLTNGWSSLTNVVANTTTTNVTDTSASGQPQRFYRVRVLP
jgi:hypothetical protein